MVLCGGRVFGVDGDLGSFQRGDGTAHDGILVIRRLGLRTGGAEGCTRLLCLIRDADLVGALARGFERIRDHECDDLAVVPDFRRCQRPDLALVRVPNGFQPLYGFGILVAQNIEHAGHVARRVELQLGNASARNGAGHQNRVGKVVDRNIGGIARFARDLRPSVEAGCRSPGTPAPRSRNRRLIASAHVQWTSPTVRQHGAIKWSSRYGCRGSYRNWPVRAKVIADARSDFFFVLLNWHAGSSLLPPFALAPGRAIVVRYRTSV